MLLYRPATRVGNRAIAPENFKRYLVVRYNSKLHSHFNSYHQKNILNMVNSYNDDILLRTHGPFTGTRAQKVVSYTVHQRTLQKRCLHMTNIGRSKALYPHHSCIVISKSTEKMRPIQKGTFAESSFRSLVAESSFRSLVVLQYKKCSVAGKSLRNTGLIDDYSLATSSFVYD